MSDDIHERDTLSPPPSLDLEAMKQKPVAARTGFENLALEVQSLGSHVADLRAIVLRVEGSVQRLSSQINFALEQTNQALTDASEEVLRSRSAVLELVPRVKDLEEQCRLCERKGEHFGSAE